MAKNTFFNIKLGANVKGYIKAIFAAMTSTNKFNKSIAVGGKGFGKTFNNMSKDSAKLADKFQTLTCKFFTGSHDQMLKLFIFDNVRIVRHHPGKYQIGSGAAYQSFFSIAR